MGKLICYKHPDHRDGSNTSVKRDTFDEAYIQALNCRDAEVERHFTAYFGALLDAKLRMRLRSRQAVEDVKQETFLRVLTTIRRKGGINNPAALGAFVNSTCNNTLFELYRQDAKTANPVQDAESGEIGAEADLVDQEEREEVREVLAGLPEKDRTILRWIFFEERSKDEICTRLSVDREYLRVLLHRAKLRFRAEFLKSHQLVYARSPAVESRSSRAVDR